MNEQKATVAILQHVLHRINEFFDERPASSFGDADPVEVSTEFARWLSKKDANL